MLQPVLVKSRQLCARAGCVPASQLPICTTSAPRTARPFSSTSCRKGRAGGPIKVLPDFTWRRPYKGREVPEVLIAETAEDGDIMLETLNSNRISIDAEPGQYSNVSLASRRAIAQTARSPLKHSSPSQGVVTLADDCGMIVLHLAKMPKPPRLLKKILENPDIEKQAFGASYIQREVLTDAAYFDHARPANVVCMRIMAEKAYPKLDDPALERQTHNVFAMALAQQLGVRYTTHDAGRNDYHVTRLQGAPLDLLLNQTWFLHCVSPDIRAKLVARIDKKLDSKLPNLPGIGEWLRRKGHEKVFEAFRLDAEDVEARMKRDGGLR